jgi:hypothetical protein
LFYHYNRNWSLPRQFAASKLAAKFFFICRAVTATIAATIAATFTATIAATFTATIAACLPRLFSKILPRVYRDYIRKFSKLCHNQDSNQRPHFTQPSHLVNSANRHLYKLIIKYIFTIIMYNVWYIFSYTNQYV